MIADRAENLLELVNKYKDAAGAAAEAQKLSNVLGGIQEPVVALQRSRPVLQVMRAHSLLEREPSLDAARRAVAESRRASNGSIRAYIDMPECASMVKAVKSAADDAAAAAIGAWQDFSTSSQHTLPSDLLTALSAVDEFRETARRAQAAAENLTSAIGRSGPIPTKVQVESAIDASRELASALDEIRSAVPPNVQDALRACLSRGGLPLSQLTEEFRSWMREHKIETSFVVHIR